MTSETYEREGDGLPTVLCVLFLHKRRHRSQVAQPMAISVLILMIMALRPHLASIHCTAG